MFHHATVAGVDTGRRLVHLRPAGAQVATLSYDHLVLALGAVPNYRGLPGVAELRQSELTFVVAGGGFAGAELVAELCDLVHDVRRYYPRVDPGELWFLLVRSQD